MSHRVPVLMYHEVAPPDQVETLSQRIYRGYVMTTDVFDRQMRYLAENGYSTLTPEELVVGFYNRSFASLPAKAVFITFDDGFAGNYLHALPILRRYNFTATVFVIVNGVTTPYMMTWNQLEAMTAAGISIQSHLMNHVAMAELTRQEAFQELLESRRTLMEQLGTTVSVLSLPNGSYHKDYASCASEAGYKAGFCSRLGFAHAASDAFFIERVPILQSTSLPRFARIVQADAGVLIGAKAKKQIHNVLDRCLGESRVNHLYHRFHRVSHPHTDVI
jgi:peptidoglycan/xylan/chitin deacetylase (PgdA/CDA1 family)